MEYDKNNNEQRPEADHEELKTFSECRSKAGVYKSSWFQVLVFVAVLIIAVGILSAIASGGKKASGSHIAVVNVNGIMLTGSSAGSIFGGTGSVYSDDVSKNIRSAADDPSVAGLVLRIDSPGGTPVAAEEISEAISCFRNTHKPIYACMDDTAASAAYWIASQCDRIFAHRTTITGSIGVIMHGGDASELMKKLGYRSQTVKSGKYKDIGTFDRPMTDEEKQLLQAMLDTTYDVFISEVAKGRKLPEDMVRHLAEGRVYSGVQAKKNGLIDEIGTYNTCIASIGKAAGLGNNPETTLMERNTSLYHSLFGISELFGSGLLNQLGVYSEKQNGIHLR